MATLKDVARLAHVDVSTVSRALNGQHYVHADTKARIDAAVKALSYQPNLLARGLRQGKRNNVAVLIPNLSVSVFGEITQAIEIEARSQNYGVLVCDTESDAELEKGYLERLRNSFVDGIIIAPTLGNQALLRKLNGEGLPVIQLIRDQDPELPGVAADYFKAGLEGTNHLLDKGCRYVGIINGPRELRPYKERHQGYLQALKDHGLRRKNRLICNCPSNKFDDGYIGMTELLASGERLDGVAVATELQALGALRAMKDHGVACPQEIRMISLSGHSIARMLERGITSMEMPSKDIGRKAFQMMAQALERGNARQTPPEHARFSAVLMERETT